MSKPPYPQRFPRLHGPRARGAVVVLGIVIIAALTWPWVWQFWVIVLGLAAIVFGFGVFIWFVSSVFLWVRDGEWYGWHDWWDDFGPF